MPRLKVGGKLKELVDRAWDALGGVDTLLLPLYAPGEGPVLLIVTRDREKAESVKSFEMMVVFAETPFGTISVVKVLCEPSIYIEVPLDPHDPSVSVFLRDIATSDKIYAAVFYYGEEGLELIDYVVTSMPRDQGEQMVKKIEEVLGETGYHFEAAVEWYYNVLRAAA